MGIGIRNEKPTENHEGPGEDALENSARRSKSMDGGKGREFGKKDATESRYTDILCMVI
jgi:hypothetical protein